MSSSYYDNRRAVVFNFVDMLKQIVDVLQTPEKILDLVEDAAETDDLVDIVIESWRKNFAYGVMKERYASDDILMRLGDKYVWLWSKEISEKIDKALDENPESTVEEHIDKIFYSCVS